MASLEAEMKRGALSLGGAGMTAIVAIRGCRGGRWAIAVIACALALALPAAASAATPAPIPSVAVPPPTAYFGAPVKPHPVNGVPRIPQNPFMAANGRSEIHNDEWQSDSYRWSGPLGRKPKTLSSLMPGRDCGSITFDKAGRVVAICISLSGPELFMFDPRTLATLATFSLPPRTAEDLKLNPNIFQDFSAGGYFYLDKHDRVVTGTTSQHIYVIAEKTGAPGFTLVHDYDLSHVLQQDEEITSQLPDSHGLLWFTARLDGVVGTLNFRTGAIHVIRLGHGADGEITKSLATDNHGGVYIPTNHKLYRFTAGRHGAPRISWQVAYPNSGEHKPGQLDAGTGTTPTLLPGGYVAINDDADPMDVMVYRTAANLHRMVREHGRLHRVKLRRQVCRVPVFTRGQSADENAMIATGRSLVIENNDGYNTPADVSGGKLTAPGFARVDLNRNGRGCHRAWTNRTDRAPTVVSKFSLASGLVYTYTKDPGSSDPWYWTAIDFRTGRTVFKQLAGTGTGYNNNYSGIAIGPDGTEYLGTLGGLIAVRDGS